MDLIQGTQMNGAMVNAATFLLDLKVVERVLNFSTKFQLGGREVDILTPG